MSFLSLLYSHLVLQEIRQAGSLHAIEVVYWDPKDPFGPDPLKLVNGRFKKILLTGSETDELRLEFAQDLIRDLKRKKYPTPGIEFTFEDGAKYASLAQLFDLCEAEKVSRYMNYQNKFWIFNSPATPRTVKPRWTNTE
ncbi:MAG TPA: hypothetical protein VIU12_09040 [Chryseolinea sp.]